MASPTVQPGFSELLHTAVTEPGILSKAYRQFHQYSIGNVLLAFVQCHARKLALGPMATYPRWQELGRQVRKGEKALTLCQPVTVKKQTEAQTGDEAEVFVRFVYRPAWFVLAQTEGADVPAATLPDWDKARALAALDITEMPFEAIDGNVMGYARGRAVAVSPINPRPFKTLFHEVAHVLLGHTDKAQRTEADAMPRSLEEAEAECVALLCCEALGLPGAEEARGYIQSWHGRDNPIPERSAQRVLRVADAVLKAGRPAAADNHGGES
jgi:antirestriction protein ArdC